MRHHSTQGQPPGKIANTINPPERFEFQSTVDPFRTACAPLGVPICTRAAIHFIGKVVSGKDEG